MIVDWSIVIVILILMVDIEIETTFDVDQS